MESQIQIRVRFNETDSMNYVYHGNYASYYHTSRTELMRKLDLSDKALGEMGIMLPVIAIDSEYKKPVAYDETISVSTKLISVSACKLSFEHTVINEEGELVNHGHSSVAFVDSISRKPIRISENIKGKLLTLL